MAAQPWINTHPVVEWRGSTRIGGPRLDGDANTRARRELRPVGRATGIPWCDTASPRRRLRQAGFASNNREGHRRAIGTISAGEPVPPPLFSRRAQRPRAWAGRRRLARVYVEIGRGRCRACTCPRGCVCSCPAIERRTCRSA
eukprot:2118241-Pleurochrysis_carterae.AAC.2